MTDIDPLDNPTLEDELGGLRRASDGTVFHPDKAIIILGDGDPVKSIQDAIDKKSHANSILWSRIGPLRYGDIKIKRRTEVWHEEREEWWIAEEISIFGDGEPSVTFMVKGSRPVRHVTLRGSTIAQLVEDETLISSATANDRLERLLEEFRTDTGVES